MSEGESFTLICKKAALLQDISLCPTMDLVALISKNSRQVSVHRIFTWERVFSFSSAELFASPACVLSWSPTGRLLAVGSEGGEIVLLDVENEGQSIDLSVVSNSYEAGPGSATDGNDAEIVRISWLDGERLHSWSEPHDFEAFRLQQEAFNNRSLPSLVGQVVLKEENDMLAVEPDESYPGLREGMRRFMLLVAFSNGMLRGYAAGAVRVFELGLARPETTLTTVRIGQSVCASDFTVSCIGLRGSNDVAPELRVLRIPTDPISKFKRVEQIAEALLQLQHNVHACSQATGACGRQWKSAPMVLKAKIGLLKSVMAGYNMQTRPSDLLYSVTFCGSWHPAVSQHFAQHWNAQGLTRLRSGIDSCTGDVIKTLRLRMLPVATNLLLQAQMLAATCYASDVLSYSNVYFPNEMLTDILQTMEHQELKSPLAWLPVGDVQQLIVEAKRFIRKVNEALLEAILTRTRMLTLLDFIQDSADRAKEDAEDVPAYDPSLVREVSKMFDPRLFRKRDDAEELSATHLYAYFAHEALPEQLVHERRRTGYFDKADAKGHSDLLETVQEMLDDQDEELHHRSLVAQLNVVDDILKTITRALCSRNRDIYSQLLPTTLGLPLLRITCTGFEEVGTAAVSRQQWQPTLSSDCETDVPQAGWESCSVVAIADGHADLFLVVVPQYSSSATRSHPLGASDQPLGLNYLAARIRLEDVRGFCKVVVYVAEEDAPKKQAPALVALVAEPSPRLVKTPLQEIELCLMSARNAEMACDINDLRQLPVCEPSYTARSLPVDGLSPDFMLTACGGRGIGTVATPDGRLFVFDMEEDEEDDEDGDEDEANDDQDEDEEKT